MFTNENNKKRILIVDDEQDTILLLKLIIEEDGFKVDSFTDPLTALSNFKKKLDHRHHHRPYYDLVILYIKMPEMNGFQLCEEMKKINASIKACFITVADERYYEGLRSSINEDEEDQYCKLDKDRFLKKPISNEDLVNEMNKIITMH
jgi:CheY-like chemotaxis protein